MSSPEKKKTTRKPSLNPSLTQESTPIPSLPDDLLLSCFARVSRLYYPTLSLASKRFRSLLASPELYQVRSSLGHQESCLYVCLLFPPYPNPNPRWFTLCRNPNKTLTYHNPHNNKKKKSSGNALATLPIPHSPPTHSSGLVTIGSNIYNIGGCVHKSPSSSVSILDCRSHTWRKAPNMRVARNNPVANVLDGKIYVGGGCDSSNWMEVFDPEKQTWELVSSPAAEICEVHKGATIDGKIYIGRYNGLAYEPKENSWESVGWMMFSSWKWNSYCVVENVIYCSYYMSHFIWYDTKVRTWRYLQGMERLPMFTEFTHVKLAEYGGKIAVLWDEVLASSGYKKKMIWCAVIALEKCNDEVICGNVEWFDEVLTVPKSYEFVHALSATV